MPPARRSATIIIPCHNGLRYTRECALSVLRCTTGAYEVIFIDNGSSDGTPRCLASLKRGAKARVRVIRNEVNSGFARAINQGMRDARGEYLVWLNNDVVVAPGWLDTLTAHLERRKRAAAVAPLVNPPEEPAGAKLPMASAAFALAARGRSSPARHLPGCCLVLRREAVENVGLLDERFGLGLFEDYDYCERLLQAGYELLQAQDVLVDHRWHASLSNLPDVEALYRSNKDLFLDKWCRRPCPLQRGGRAHAHPRGRLDAFDRRFLAGILKRGG